MTLPSDFDGIVFDKDTFDTLSRAAELFNAAFGEHSPDEFQRKFNELCAAGKYAAARRLWLSIDREKLGRAIAAWEQGLDRMQWVVAGVEVPESAWQLIKASPRRQSESILAGIEAGIRALAGKHPKLGRILENATARREEGQVFAEASREVRDRNYRERVEWVAAKYREVRRKYRQGDAGDKAARLEVAVLYSRLTGKKPMHDRSVRNLLAAAPGVESAMTAETAE